MKKVRKLVGKLDEFLDTDDGEVHEDDFEKICKDKIFRDILFDLNMPLGFTMEDLQAMLDEDQDGSIKHKEFVQGLQRLIYCNEFQHVCLAKLERARLLHNIKRTNMQLNSFKEELVKHIDSSLQVA